MRPDSSPFPQPGLGPSVATASPPPSDDNFAAGLRGFGPLGLVAIAAIVLSGNVFIGNMVVVPVAAPLTLLWVWRSRTPWRQLGYARPRSWIATVVAGIAFGIALKFAMKALVMPLFGADPVNQAFRFLAGNTAMLPAAVWAMFVAGFGEETVFRGFMFERLGKLFGTGGGAKTLAVLITSLWFGGAHYAGQGLAGVEQATVVGLVFGAIFAVTGRIWMLMIAHTAFDLTALGMIYWNLEAAVARLIFK
jgi:membrane protease YdiL (CAAX protease family)